MWYVRAAKQGNPAAQFNLGLMYDIGEGVTPDYKRAIKWYRLAAKLNNAQAQFNLGQLYESGERVTQDF